MGDVVSIDPRTGEVAEVVAQETSPEEVARLCAAALADHANLQLAPHFAMEIHVHLAAAYPHEPWVEHFDWLYPLFNERLETRDGRMHLSDRPGLGVTLTEQARAWTVDRVHIDAPR